MNRVREAAERVLRWLPYVGGKDFDQAVDELRAALSEPDLEGAVVEAARNLVNLRRRKQADLGYSAEAAHLCMVVDALDAARRPRYEAYPISFDHWGIRVGMQHPPMGVFRGPDAERHAKEWAARMNERGA